MKRTRRGMVIPISACVLLLCDQPLPSALTGSDCRTSRVAGRVAGIKVGNDSHDVVEAAQMSVRRSGTSVVGQRGMALCYGDEIATGDDASAVLRLAEPAKGPTIFVVYSNSRIQLTDPTSLFLRAGRLFAELRGTFEVVTGLSRLGVRGTAFEVESTAEMISVKQMEGLLLFTPTGASRGASAPSQGRPGAFSRAPFAAPPACGQGTATSRQFAPCHLEPIRYLNFERTADRTPRFSTRTMTPDECQESLDRSSDALFATEPRVPSENLLLSLRAFVLPLNKGFREARFRTLWWLGQGRPASDMEVGLYAEWLGDIYLNWGEGAKALAAYERGSGFVREGQELADYYTKVATAHRLAGAFKEAETFYQKTIDLNLSVVSAYNGLGDMYRDQAVGQITDGNIASATTALETARRSYQKIPFDPVLWGRYDSPQYRAIPPYNLAEVYRLLGSIGAKATPRGAGRVNDFETT